MKLLIHAFASYADADCDGGFAEFFNDRQRSSVGPYLDSTITDEDDIAPPLTGGQNFCLVAHDFGVPDAEDKFGCATVGDDGPVRRYINTKLMVSPEGFWFTYGVECYSAKIITAVILWSVLEDIALRGC